MFIRLMCIILLNEGKKMEEIKHNFDSSSYRALYYTIHLGILHALPIRRGSTASPLFAGSARTPCPRSTTPSVPTPTVRGIRSISSTRMGMPQIQYMILMGISEEQQ